MFHFAYRGVKIEWKFFNHDISFYNLQDPELAEAELQKFKNWLSDVEQPIHPYIACIGPFDSWACFFFKYK